MFNTLFGPAPADAPSGGGLLGMLVDAYNPGTGQVVGQGANAVGLAIIAGSEGMNNRTPYYTLTTGPSATPSPTLMPVQQSSTITPTLPWITPTFQLPPSTPTWYITSPTP